MKGLECKERDTGPEAIWFRNMRWEIGFGERLDPGRPLKAPKAARVVGTCCGTLFTAHAPGVLPVLCSWDFLPFSAEAWGERAGP